MWEQKSLGERRAARSLVGSGYIKPGAFIIENPADKSCGKGAKQDIKNKSNIVSASAETTFNVRLKQKISREQGNTINKSTAVPAAATADDAFNKRLQQKVSGDKDVSHKSKTAESIADAADDAYNSRIKRKMAVEPDSTNKQNIGEPPAATADDAFNHRLKQKLSMSEQDKGVTQANKVIDNSQSPDELTIYKGSLPTNHSPDVAKPNSSEPDPIDVESNNKMEEGGPNAVSDPETNETGAGEKEDREGGRNDRRSFLGSAASAIYARVSATGEYLVSATLVEEEVEGEVVIAEPGGVYEQRVKRKVFAFACCFVVVAALCVSIPVVLLTQQNIEGKDMIPSEVPSMTPSTLPSMSPSFDPRPTLEIIRERGHVRCGNSVIFEKLVVRAIECNLFILFKLM